jgi:lipopolysaccharide biosynthesis glycosyltransferase
LIRCCVGYDSRESIAYHVLTQSIINRTTSPVSITPLTQRSLGEFDGQRDGTNQFIYSRFLVPQLMDYEGWAIYLDSDMLLRADLAELWALRDESKAVMVVKHDYQTKTFTKLIGTPMEARNEHYPRKNQSSLMLWNCGHRSNHALTLAFVAEAEGRVLHRFEWLGEDEIGSLPTDWNWLVGEMPFNPAAKLAHFTLGMPGFSYYKNCDYSPDWRDALASVERADDLAIARRWHGMQRF